MDNLRKKIMAHKKLIAYTDGGARGNPGPAAFGVVIGETYMHGEYIGETTNNIAEYSGLVYALKHAKKGTDEADMAKVDLEVRMDSELIVKQMKGVYKVKHPTMKAQFARVMKAKEAFKEVSFTHVPRAQNADADALANEAMDRGSNPK